jgi:hypothetical protein
MLITKKIKTNIYCYNKNNTERFIGIYRYYSTGDLGSKLGILNLKS